MGKIDIIRFALVISIIIGIFPPWYIEQKGGVMLGYYPIWIFVIQDINNLFGTDFYSLLKEDNVLNRARINYNLLKLQWVIVSLISILFYYCFVCEELNVNKDSENNENDNSKNPVDDNF